MNNKKVILNKIARFYGDESPITKIAAFIAKNKSFNNMDMAEFQHGLEWNEDYPNFTHLYLIYEPLFHYIKKVCQAMKIDYHSCCLDNAWYILIRE